MEKAYGRYDDHNWPCTSCGGTEFHGGWIRCRDGGRAQFEVDGRTVFDMLGRGRSDVSARVCRRCQRLDLYAVGLDFEDLEAHSE